MTVQVLHGDSRELLKAIPDASIDSCVCDPPYALVSIVKRFGKPGSSEAKAGATGAYQRASSGFMGKSWDTGETAFDPAFWAEVLRVLKPGAHVVAFSGTRTYHRLACAVEDGGFEIRDMLAWLYGSGFPKSHDVSKGIDKAAGATREVIGEKRAGLARKARAGADLVGNASFEELRRAEITVPATNDAAAWAGWGTALKPALEPIVFARKPLVGTVAANVLANGTGALNIDASRIHAEDAQGGEYTVKRLKPGATLDKTGGNWRPENGMDFHGNMKPGRWPANVVHDGSDEVVAAFPAAPGQQRPVTGDERSHRSRNAYGDFGSTRDGFEPRQDSGSAARFFYAFEPDNLCGLCRCPMDGKSGKVPPCNANTAEPSSPTENTPSDATAPNGAVASPSLVRGDKSRPSSGHATSAESPSSRRRQTDSDTAAADASMPPPSSLVQNVRSAGNLCGSCATAIAQSLAASRQGLAPASQALPASISERSGQILLRHLALYVEGRESTDTILTTASLKTLLGSVFHASAESTPPSGEKPSALSGRSKRFWYSSKADAEDRLGSKHPTVKPVDLMRWLVTLVTPPGGVVLDPFAGTGSTGLAALGAGFDCILMEREAEYIADINRRLDWARGAGRLTAQEIARPFDETKLAPLPLFGGEAA